MRTINPEYFPILISFPGFWGEVQGAGRTETSSNQDRIATRRGRIDAAWESQKRKKGIGRRIYCRARETTGGLKTGNRREKRRGGPGRKSSRKRGLKRRKRCEAEGMTQLVAMATLSGERSPDGRAWIRRVYSVRLFCTEYCEFCTDTRLAASDCVQRTSHWYLQPIPSYSAMLHR